MGLVFFLGFGGRSQWSTLQSGPLARAESLENGGNWGKSHEPVVHSVEWTTSSQEKAENGPKARKSIEPVVHSGQWTTSSAKR